MDRWASAGYWLEHPELLALLQTGLGMLRLLSRELDRAIASATAVGEAGEAGPPWTRDLERTVAYWEAETRRFGSSAFWEDKLLMRARLKTALALLRLLAAQGAQALQAQQRSGDARD